VKTSFHFFELLLLLQLLIKVKKTLNLMHQTLK